MTQKLRLLVFSLIIPLILESCVERQSFAKEDKLEQFFAKKEVIVAVMDSGLPGHGLLH